jgi:uncharacterized protein
MSEHMEFDCKGERLVGRLFLPQGKPIAALVTTGPTTSVKEQASGAYAEALGERGFAALAFDHRYFGASGGKPRQFEHPAAKVEDIRAAVAALKKDSRTTDLPIFAVGVCAGGGYMASAVAEEPAFTAFAAVAGYFPEAPAASDAGANARIARGRIAEQKRSESGIADMIPAVAPEGGDVAMPLREAYEFYGTPRGAVPGYVNQYAVQSFAYTTSFDAVSSAPRIKVPTLVVHSENALAPALARKFIAGLEVRHEAVWLVSQGQIDFYDDPKLIAAATDRIAAFFRKTRD